MKLWHAVLASGLGLSAGAAWAQDFILPVIEEVVPPPELGPQHAIDIGRYTWRVAATDAASVARPDYDDSSWVARAGVSPELLRNHVAWYRFAFLLSAGSRGLGSRLELGGVEGNVAVYLNGTLVGEMRGATDPPHERLEEFTLPARLLGQERNVLSLRLTGFAGRHLVGIPRGPIRLLPLSVAYESDDRARRAAYDAAQRAARDAEPAPTSLSFGRFGRDHVEGLLTASLSPAGFQGATTSADPRPVSGRFGDPGRQDRIALERIAPEGKGLRVLQASGSRYRLSYPLLYPGFAVEPLGATLSVAISDPLDVMWVDRWGIATSSARIDARLPWTEPWALFHDPAGRRPPVLVALPSPRFGLRLKRTAGAFAIELPPKAIARFCWPTGIAPWRPSAASRPDDMARFRTWADAMVPMARRAQEAVRSDRLTVVESFSYLPAGSMPYAPLPPVFGLLLEAGGAGMSVPAIAHTGIPTLAGPLWWVPRSSVLRFELPVPAGDVRAEPRLDGSPALAAGELPDPAARHAMDLAYTRRSEAFGRWSRLSRAGRAALEANGSAQLNRAWSPFSWAGATEPLTGTPYRWTWATWGPEARIRDVGKANGLALYGTALAAQHTGDWSVVTAHWPRIRQAFDWFAAAFDWAWQAPAVTDAGDSTGDGEAVGGAYLGAAGMARMAATVAPAEKDRYLAYLARMRPLLERRDLLERYARRQGLLPERMAAVGLRETGVLVASESSRLPWPLGSEAPLGRLASLDPGSVPVATATLDAKAPVALLEWAPARLEDFVWKPQARTLEAKFTFRQPVERFGVVLEAPRPVEVLWGGAPAVFQYDPARGLLAVTAGKAAGTQTLLARFW